MAPQQLNNASATILLNWYVELDRSRVAENEGDERGGGIENRAREQSREDVPPIELSNCRTAVVM